MILLVYKVYLFCKWYDTISGLLEILQFYCHPVQMNTQDSKEHQNGRRTACPSPLQSG